MNGYNGWRTLSAELADVVHTTGPRVALVGTVIAAIVAVPLLLRLLVYLPGVS